MSESSSQDVVVLTALNLEYEAVRTHLTGVQQHTHPAGTRYEVGLLPGSSGWVVVAVTGEGTTTAGVLAERAISLFSPKAIFFVGVAGALADDIALGDVVVPTRVYAYHSGREEAGEFWARPRAWETPHHLEQLARQVARSRSWLGLLPESAHGHPPSVHFRPIAAGEVVLNSRTTPLALQIRRHYNDAAAIEMEGAGFAQAAHLNRSLPMMIVRGISDTARGDKDMTDRAGWQPRAAAHAAAFALAVVRELAAAPATPRPAAEPAPQRLTDLTWPGNNYGFIATGNATVNAAGLAVGPGAHVVAYGGPSTGIDRLLRQLAEVDNLINQNLRELPNVDGLADALDEVRTELTSLSPNRERVMAALNHIARRVDAVDAVAATVSELRAAVRPLLR